MGYTRFLTDLFEDGRVVASEVEPISEQELHEGDELLARFEREYRLDLPAPLPEFQAAAGGWAACKFYRACQFVVFRDESAQRLDQELSGAYGARLTPAVHYSVDLVFRYLPDLKRFAASASESDPLLQHLVRWARQWPLSSVGMPELDDIAIDGFADDRSLLQLYADRIIATGDASRLSDPRVREAVRASLGMYPHLAPKIGAALREDEVQEPSS